MNNIILFYDTEKSHRTFSSIPPRAVAMRRKSGSSRRLRGARPPSRWGSRGDETILKPSIRYYKATHAEITP